MAASIFDKLMSDDYGPGHSAFTIVPHATNQLQQDGRDVALRGLWVGGAGTVIGYVLTESGAETAITFAGIPAGTMLNVAFTRILATSTATLMVGVL